jgi:DNA repair protein RadD
LLEQDLSKLLTIWPKAPAGVYSAQLKRRDIKAQILFAGIQSIYKRGYELQKVDLIIIDECHLLSPNDETRYRKLISDLTIINSYIKVIGLSATPFRLDSGYLHEGDGALFTDICYETDVLELIKAGYLAPLVSKAMTTKFDLSNLHTRGGEFIPSEVIGAMDQEALTESAVAEIVQYGHDRKTWICFCSGVDHAFHVRDAIRRHGFTCETITGETPKDERAAILAGAKSGKIRCLTNHSVLTTGIDIPGIDLLAFLRPTKSAALYIQMAGRAMRTAPGKENGLVLDFAGVVALHGPVDKVRIKDKIKGDGVAPTKVCPTCESIVFAGARECPDCGHQFPAPELKIAATAAVLPILSTQFVPPQWVAVDDVSYRRHEKPGKPPSLKVTYQCGLTSFQEWVCLCHDGFARQKAAQWWLKRAPGIPVPNTIEDALANAHALAQPTKISIRPSGQFTEIVGVSFQ